MPRRRQPRTLENIAIKAVVMHVAAVLKKLLTQICGDKENDTTVPEAIRNLRSSLDPIKQYLCIIPIYVYDDLSSKLFDEIKLLFDDLVQSSRAANRKEEIAGYLAEVAIGSKIRILEILTRPRALQNAVIVNLPKMRNLEVLEIMPECTHQENLIYSAFRTHNMILMGLSAMVNLTTFDLVDCCTDSIIAVIGQSCLKLQCLSADGSRFVTDRCISSLRRCSKLRRVYFSETSVTVCGYEQLLKEHPGLEELEVSNHWGDLDRAGKPFGCIRAYGLNIKKIIVGSVEELENGLVYFPNASEVRIQNFHNNLTLLASFQKLRHLCIIHGESNLVEVPTSVLELRGANLVSLEFAFNINEYNLRIVGKFCPNVESLSISLEILATGQQHPSVLLFPELKKLKSLIVTIMRNMIDIFFYKCTMENLRELILFGKMICSVEKIRFLIDKCCNLKTLDVGTHNWEPHGYPVTELRILKEELNQNNVYLRPRFSNNY